MRLDIRLKIWLRYVFDVYKWGCTYLQGTSLADAGRKATGGNSLQTLWPLGRCAMMATHSADNSKVRLEPKPSQRRSRLQTTMLTLGRGPIHVFYSTYGNGSTSSLLIISLSLLPAKLVTYLAKRKVTSQRPRIIDDGW